MYDDTWRRAYKSGLGGAGEALLRGGPLKTQQARAAAVVMDRIAEAGVVKKAIYKGMMMDEKEAGSFGMKDVLFGPTAWSERKSIAEAVLHGPGVDEEGSAGVLVTVRNCKSMPAGADVLAERVSAGRFKVVKRYVDVPCQESETVSGVKRFELVGQSKSRQAESGVRKAIASCGRTSL